jgi:thiol-disulfide isomerase/thioredoxin
MTGFWVLLAVLTVCTAVGVVSGRRSGRLRARTAERSGRSEADDLLAVLSRLGEVPGERATLLQFSSAFCAPCRATRRILGEVAGVVPGVRHVEVDAEQHLDLVRRLGVSRTPTTIVLDAVGRESARATGQPRKPEVLAALGHAVP